MTPTWMNVSLSGGHWQGILTGFPSAPATPSQSPVPVGFVPASMPKSGTSAGSMLAEVPVAEDDADAGEAADDAAAGEDAAGAAAAAAAGGEEAGADEAALVALPPA